ncbi:MAG: ABC transporter permease [Candidatus Riflebacteria bacterium]|nr:ABC transporter permease [Candidatus Riflebacteria bacterium]
MQRFITLLAFEIKKIFARKKAFLFLLGLNVVPILGGILALIIFAKYKTWGLDSVRFSILGEALKGLFTAHLKLFAWISPFFLALIIGDSFCGEFYKGHMKTLLLTPVTRLQIIVAKSMAVMFYLLLAIVIGGLFLQVTLGIAKNISESPQIIMDYSESSTQSLIGPIAALKLLLISFVANLPIIGFFVLFALFSESPILMAFSGLLVLMFLQTYTLMAPTLAKFDQFYGQIAEWVFTRHSSKLFEINTLNKIMDGTLKLIDGVITQAIFGSLGWAIFFFVIAAFVFRRRAILG